MPCFGLSAVCVQHCRVLLDVSLLGRLGEELTRPLSIGGVVLSFRMVLNLPDL